jgi:branched-chain amino acid transport system substrate-binding protein
MRTVAFCLILLGLLLSAAAGASAAEPIKVGVILSTTGPGAYFGEPAEKTVRLEIERINREGGVLGRHLQLFFYDDGSDTKQAVSFARKLIDQDKVDVLIGGSLTGPTLAIIPLAEEAGIPLLAQPGALSVIEPLKRWVFLVAYTDRMALEKDFADMQKRKFTKIGLIAGSRGFDDSCRRQANLTAPKFGINIVADETYAPTDTDMTPQLIRIREHKEIQAVLSCGSQAPTVITVRNYHQLGMSKIPLYFTHAVISPTFLSGVGSTGEGLRAVAPALAIAEQLPDKDPQKKPALEYTKAYEAAYRQPIVIYGGQALDSITLYVAALKKAGTADKAKVRDAMEQLTHVIGVDGVFSMSAADHNGLTPAALHVLEIRGGKWKLLY